MTRSAYSIGFCLAAPFLLALGLASPPQHPQGGHGAPDPLAGDAWGAEQAAHLFASRCASCHTVPDARFATDRAWLTQIADTA